MEVLVVNISGYVAIEGMLTRSWVIYAYGPT